MKSLLATGLAALLLLSGCTVIVLTYYYRHMDHPSRWECSYGTGGDHCSLTVADAVLDASSLNAIGSADGTGASAGAAMHGRYAIDVRIKAGETPVLADLLKSHLILPDDSVLAPVAVTELGGAQSSAASNVADPQLMAVQQQRSFELQFSLDGLPDAYIFSLAPLILAGKQHSPPLLAMRIEYGSN